MEFENKNVKDIYNDISSYFNNTRTYTWSWINGALKDLPKNSVICDLGCGNGRNMNNKNYKFIGIDNSTELLKICQDKNLNVLQGDMCDIPLNDNSVDCVMCIAAFHHLSTPERRKKSLHEMKRITKPGGKIIISVWSINQPKKTRREFLDYGDTIVNWNQRGKIYKRYYYIFKINEIINLFQETDLILSKHIWDCGNEIFIVQ
jgi:alkylated DNA repair protein alkB family protein 8